MIDKNETLLPIKSMVDSTPFRIIISNANSSSEYKKVDILLKDDYYQCQQYTQKQVFHVNLKKEELVTYLTNSLDNFSQIESFADSVYCIVKISKKGKVFFTKKNQVAQNKTENKMIPKTVHNREKNYILREGEVIEPLIDMGIFTKEGKVVNSMADKFRQINRFVELIDDAIKKENIKTLNIIDFGCGKSYLTFILYYYFTQIKKIDVNMVGLDLKEEVIKNCNIAAKKYGYNNLKFELGDINGYKAKFSVDMVISLHACDTATDFALFNAINWNAKMIFSVPCCQHEVNNQIKSDSFSLLTRYGIIKDRVSALITDSIRGNILTLMGYQTQILEFVDISHTPKNLLIRATKANISKEKKAKAKQEIESIINEFSLEPTLYKLLGLK